MPEVRYLQRDHLPGNAGQRGSVASGLDGEPFLVFTIRPLGLCALPITAVQAVSAADGPVRRVPLRGGAGSRFLGLVSVRGQVQMLFDLSVVPSLQGAMLPPPARDEHLLVAVAADGRTLALRVLPPLRLVRRQSEADTPASGSGDGRSGNCKAGISDCDAGLDRGDSRNIRTEDESILNVCDYGVSLNADDEEAQQGDVPVRPKKMHVIADSAGVRACDIASADGGDAFAVPVCGSFAIPDAEGETVWLLCADQLFAQLEAEARRG